jgi:hypothetical protein
MDTSFVKQWYHGLDQFDVVAYIMMFPEKNDVVVFETADYVLFRGLMVFD